MVKKSMTRRAGRMGGTKNKGPWTAEEDQKLADYVRVYGDRRWRSLPIKAGLNRCGKSCRLRWLNYLRPGIKRGNISEDEEDLIIRLHNLLGNRWSLIAGRLPGRTDNEIKNHWNTHLSKKSLTISDLNSKFHEDQQSRNNSLQIFHPPPPQPSKETEPCNANVGHPLPVMLEREGLLNLPSPQQLREVEYGADLLSAQGHCEGPYMLLFQPPNLFENFVVDDAVGYNRSEDSFLRFTPF